jgi:hypothetical protein
MSKRLLVPTLLLAVSAAGCSTGPDAGGPITIAIQQSLTGQTTAAGTFRMSGAFTDEGATTEELTFGGPLTQSPVPVTFRRTLTGAGGALTIRGAASLSFTSPTAATLTGTWEVESGTGQYAGMTGTGSLSGAADFGATPPGATLSYTGTIAR